MCLPDLLVGDIVDAHEHFRFVGPAREMFVVNRHEKGTGPGEGVDAVGDGVNLETREELPGNLPMFLGDSVDVTAQVERQEGHVEVSFSAEFPKKTVRYEVAEDPLDHIVRELVVAGFHRRVRGEDTVLHDPLDIPALAVLPAVEAGPSLLDQQFESQQARMPFVHVVFANDESQGV